MANECIGTIGPWGAGYSGDSWTFELNGSKLTEIWIASGDYIDSLRFIYKDQNGDTHQSPKYGGNGGILRKIKFLKDEEEELIEIGGTTGKYVNSLYFHTNKWTFGPYGRVKGTHFSLPVAKGKFVGFFGYSGAYIDRIGAILEF
ncbi:hypothetical protein OSB04_001643 [Centaurea solstitialis]|uniref:Jacalin-type lectin domain-containing protein n=1 Tax=Centaurea solstitialis TaxID=347529 RepID=A0AA38U9I6_9ASTR|nr:hypothetical protein OSB04_001643 [Centaurea solstitialis]